MAVEWVFLRRAGPLPTPCRAGLWPVLKGDSSQLAWPQFRTRLGSPAEQSRQRCRMAANGRLGWPSPRRRPQRYGYNAQAATGHAATWATWPQQQRRQWWRTAWRGGRWESMPQSYFQRCLLSKDVFYLSLTIAVARVDYSKTGPGYYSFDLHLTIGRPRFMRAGWYFVPGPAAAGRVYRPEVQSLLSLCPAQCRSLRIVSLARRMSLLAPRLRNVSPSRSSASPSAPANFSQCPASRCN